MVVGVRGLAQVLKGQFHKVLAVLLPLIADQAGLPDPTFCDDRHDSRGMIVGVNPVPNIFAFAVQLRTNPNYHVGDLAGMNFSTCWYVP